jgi:peptide/nickel transport system substrate-binding protein
VNTRRLIALAAAVTAVSALAACSGNAPAAGNASAGYDAALTAVVHPSGHRGGTVIFDDSGTPDSTDPGNTYIGYMWNFVRLYGRTLVTYRSAPGAAGLQLVPDLATSLGQVSDHGLTWTYHLKPGIKFEDGSIVTSQDVKYAVERSYAKNVLPNGPSYFRALLQDPAYPGPYEDRTPGRLGLTSVQTPDPATIVFHLRQPFADFDYVVAMPQTVPVPPARDTGANYQLHPVSTGPYMFQDYQLGKQLTLVRNPYWNPATDPNRKQLADTIIVDLNINSATIASNLIRNYAQVDMSPGGEQAAAQAQILQDPALKANADDVPTEHMLFTYINTKVAPLDNVHCRRAVEYAADKVADQTAYGGPVGGDIASTVLPPGLTGYQKFDLYETAAHPHGDLARARQELAACGQPDGFSTTMAFIIDIPKARFAAAAEQQALARVGIKVTLQGYPSATFYTDFAGVPNYVHRHDLGLAVGNLGPDWPDGYAFLYYLVAGPAILPVGNENISELNDPAVNHMFTTALATTSIAARTMIWSQIDRRVMSDAAILPGVNAKLLLYRNPHLTNVYVERYYEMYDFASLGIS